MKHWSFFRLAIFQVLILFAFLTGTGSSNANAEVTISGDGGNYTLEARDATRLEIAQSVAEFFDATLSGSLDDGPKISAVLAGDFKRLVDDLFGADNYILAYDQDRLAEIIVFDGALHSLPQMLSSIEAPQYSSDLVPLEKNISDGDQVDNVDPVTDVVYRPVRVVGDDVSGAKSQDMASKQAASFGNNGKPRELPSDLRSLQEQAAQNLMGLVDALNALCPPGKSC